MSSLRLCIWLCVAIRLCNKVVHRYVLHVPLQLAWQLSGPRRALHVIVGGVCLSSAHALTFYLLQGPLLVRSPAG